MNSIPKDNPSYPLITVDPIENTPFCIVQNETEAFLVMGDHKISPPLKSKEEVLEWAEDNHWLIITNVVIILIKRHEDYMKEIAKTPYETESL